MSDRMRISPAVIPSLSRDLGLIPAVNKPRCFDFGCACAQHDSEIVALLRAEPDPSLKAGLRTRPFVPWREMAFGSVVGQGADLATEPETRKNSHTLKRGLRTSFACSPAFRLGSCAGTFFENQPRMNTDRKNSHTLKRGLHAGGRDGKAVSQPRMSTDRDSWIAL